MAKILIAEDDIRIMRVCHMWLSRQGHTVLQVTDGQAAMDILLRDAVDLLLSDVNMPGLDGTALVRWWRAERGSAAPVILFTATFDPGDITASLAEYDITVLPKPFSPAVLVEAVERLLQAPPNSAALSPRGVDGQRR